MSVKKKALIVIDLQNDYFPEGTFPLWNTTDTLNNVVESIVKAKALGWEIVLVQHIANSKMGIAPFFNENSPGAEIHPAVRAAASAATIVRKEFADSFHLTNLQEVLQNRGVAELFICGMMTQNCVTHTAISKTAEGYAVSVLADCCTTVDQMIHNIALHALSTRVPLLQFKDAVN